MLDFGADHVVLATGSALAQTASAPWARRLPLSPRCADRDARRLAGDAAPGPIVIYDDDHYFRASALAEKLSEGRA